MSFLLSNIRRQGTSCAWVLLFLSTAAPSSRVFSKDPLTPTQILDAMTARATAFPPFAMHVEVEMYNASKPVDSQHYSTYVFEQRYDGKRFDSVMTRYSVKNGNLQHNSENRRVFTGDRYLYRQSSPKLGKVMASFYSPKKARADFGDQRSGRERAGRGLGQRRYGTAARRPLPASRATPMPPKESSGGS